jgi:hypothetical protein
MSFRDVLLDENYIQRCPHRGSRNQNWLPIDEKLGEDEGSKQCQKQNKKGNEKQPAQF